MNFCGKMHQLVQWRSRQKRCISTLTNIIRIFSTGFNLFRAQKHWCTTNKGCVLFYILLQYMKNAWKAHKPTKGHNIYSKIVFECEIVLFGGVEKLSKEW